MYFSFATKFSYKLIIKWYLTWLSFISSFFWFEIKTNKIHIYLITNNSGNQSINSIVSMKSMVFLPIILFEKKFNDEINIFHIYDTNQIESYLNIQKNKTKQTNILKVDWFKHCMFLLLLLLLLWLISSKFDLKKKFLYGIFSRFCFFPFDLIRNFLSKQNK